MEEEKDDDGDDRARSGTAAGGGTAAGIHFQLDRGIVGGGGGAAGVDAAGPPPHRTFFLGAGADDDELEFDIDVEVGLHSGYVDHTGCHQLNMLSIHPMRVAATPGGCQIGYVDRSGHQLDDVLTRDNNVGESANPTWRRKGRGGPRTF
jgi:hypothetical protein